MRIGKVKESILKRSVLRQLHNHSEEGSLASGEDAGVLFMPEFSEDAGVALSVNPIEGWTFAAKRAVYGAVNSMLAAGAKIKAISLSTLILSVTAMGIQKKKEEARAEYTNLDLVIAGTIGREGAAMIATEHADRLEERYAPSYIETAKHLFDDGSMSAVSDILQEREVISIHDVREGGIFAALWEMAAAKNVGLSVDLKNIPIRQHTIEVCEYFNLNPYMLRSGGTLLLACANGARLVEQFQKAGIESAVIGQTTSGNDRLIHYDEEARVLEPTKMD